MEIPGGVPRWDIGRHLRAAVSHATISWGFFHVALRPKFLAQAWQWGKWHEGEDAMLWEGFLFQFVFFRVDGDNVAAEDTSLILILGRARVSSDVDAGFWVGFLRSAKGLRFVVKVCRTSSGVEETWLKTKIVALLPATSTSHTSEVWFELIFTFVHCNL